MTWHSPYNWMNVERSGKVTVVTITGKTIVEEKTIRIIEEELIRLVDNYGNRDLVLNFEEVKNLSSYMLAALVKLHKKAQSAGGRLALCEIDPELQKVFAMTRLDKVLSIYPTEPEALQSF
jgi:anti-sigma B factor antagonist